jgi:hypothetical protein
VTDGGETTRPSTGEVVQAQLYSSCTHKIMFLLPEPANPALLSLVTIFSMVSLISLLSAPRELLWKAIVVDTRPASRSRFTLVLILQRTPAQILFRQRSQEA